MWPDQRSCNQYAQVILSAQTLQNVFYFWPGVIKVLVKICVETPILPGDEAPLWEDGIQLIASSNQRQFRLRQHRDQKTQASIIYTRTKKNYYLQADLFFPLKSQVVQKVSSSEVFRCKTAIGRSEASCGIRARGWTNASPAPAHYLTAT